MKIFLLLCCFAALHLQAADLAPALADLNSDNYKARTQARNDILEQFSAATDATASSEPLESMLSTIYPLLDGDLPLESRLYLIHMVELFGNESAAEKLYLLLGNSSPEVRGSARRALAALKADSANSFLLTGLQRAPDEQRAAYIQALAYSRYAPAAEAIAQLLQSPNSDLQAAAARGLGLLGQEASRAALYAARGTVAPENTVIVESALLKIGVNVPVAEELIRSGASSAIRVNAFEALMGLDASAAASLLKTAIAEPEFPARAGMFALAARSSNSSIKDVLLGSLASLSVADQMLAVAAIADSRARQYEPALLDLLPTDSKPLQMAVIDALGWMGGDASFAALYDLAIENPDDDLIVDALARLNAPAADERVVAAVKNAADSESAIAALQIMALRNSPGGTALVNSIARSSSDEALVQAAYLAIEKIGNVDSIQLLLDAVIAGGANQRAAQRSLKRFSLNFGLPEMQWTSVYEPALENATASQKVSVILILDGVACESSLNYLKANLSDPELSPAIIRTLQRWTSYDVASVWLSIASADGASEKDISTAAKGLQRTFSSKSMDGNFRAKAEAAVAIIEQTSNPEIKKAVLAPFQEGIPRWDTGNFKRAFEPLTSDPDIGAAIAEIIK
jgi:HEAT repeat protein